MKRPTKNFAVLVLILSAVLPSRQEEMWIPPTPVGPMRIIGDWAAAKLGKGRSAYFVFAVPGDFKVMEEVTVALISVRDAYLYYDVSLSVAKSKMSIHFKESMQNLGPVALSKGKLHDINLTEIFPSGLVGGQDYCSLHFSVRGEQGALQGIQAVGLRLSYFSNRGGIVIDESTGNLNVSATMAVGGKVMAEAFAGTSPVIFEAPQGTERMRIDEDGNVGIGTQNPNKNLDVDGDVVARALDLSGPVTAEAFSSAGDDGSPLILDAPKLKERLRIDSVTGDVTVGNVVPGIKFDVKGEVAVGGKTVIDSAGRWVEPTAAHGWIAYGLVVGQYPSQTITVAADESSSNFEVTRGNGWGLFCIKITDGTVPRVALANLNHGGFHGSAHTILNVEDCHIMVETYETSYSPTTGKFQALRKDVPFNFVAF